MKRANYKTIAKVDGLDYRKISELMSLAGYEYIGRETIREEVNKAVRSIIKAISDNLGVNKHLKKEIEFNEALEAALEDVLYKAYESMKREDTL